MVQVPQHDKQYLNNKIWIHELMCCTNKRRGGHHLRKRSHDSPCMGAPCSTGCCPRIHSSFSCDRRNSKLTRIQPDDRQHTWLHPDIAHWLKDWNPGLDGNSKSWLFYQLSRLQPSSSWYRHPCLGWYENGTSESGTRMQPQHSWCPPD